jgi:hypothetical protein
MGSYLKVFLMLEPFRQEKGIPRPTSMTIGRMIADAPDKMGH